MPVEGAVRSQAHLCQKFDQRWDCYSTLRLTVTLQQGSWDGENNAKRPQTTTLQTLKHLQSYSEMTFL